MHTTTPLFLTLLSFRLFNALSLRTYFQPDEFWQALEPAHRLVYGYGYLTWEWRDGLRSIAHPLLFAAIYKINELLRLGETGLIHGPKVLQAIFAAIADYQVILFSKQNYGYEISQISTIITVTSAFNFFVSCRTFSNSLEMTLLITGLRYWPIKTAEISINIKNVAKALALAAIACVLRPTNALIWAYLGMELVVRLKALAPIFTAIAIGSVVFLANALVDIWYYGEVTFPVLNFIKFNLVESLSLFYGANRKLYYLIEAIPQLLTVQTPFFFHGLYLARRSVLARASIFVVVIYSVVSHKEVRFIFPLLPIFHVLSALSIKKLRIFQWPRLRWAFVFALLVINLPLTIYASFVHQRGVIDVTTYIRRTPEISSVGFLMPCHSTPWMSHIHRSDISAWFLTCEPPRSSVDISAYRDEADQFYDDPFLFLNTHFPALNESSENDISRFKFNWPSHIVIFGALENTFKGFVGNSYIEVQRLFNSHIHDDNRRKGDVIVYKKYF
ncbi:Alg9-like mannosyltransferase family-domain-containing protein [Lipomyces japonicus]|uniref:Alg9-like mannosyltransferase family-domain-containing protein n=1 Tax=Lipomyces japonicus TaxID=56871 RepID=UPI0034CD96E7